MYGPLKEQQRKEIGIRVENLTCGYVATEVDFTSDAAVHRARKQTPALHRW